MNGQNGVHVRVQETNRSRLVRVLIEMWKVDADKYAEEDVWSPTNIQVCFLLSLLLFFFHFMSLDSRLLIVAPNTGKVVLMNPDDPRELTCPLPQFPTNVYDESTEVLELSKSSYGIWLEGTPLICSLSGCYNLKDFKFQSVDYSIGSRILGSSISINDSLWIAGGYTKLTFKKVCTPINDTETNVIETCSYNVDEKEYSNKTKLLTLNASSDFVELPKQMVNHCLAKINESMAIVTHNTSSLIFNFWSCSFSYWSFRASASYSFLLSSLSASRLSLSAFFFST